MNIFVTIISHRHGIDVYPHETIEGAVKSAADFAREYWNETGIDEPPPEDDKAAVDAYFEVMNDRGEYLESLAGSYQILK